MKIRRQAEWQWNYSALAFIFPVVGMLAVMAACKYMPFGKTAMLYSDMYHQYYPFFAEFRRVLRSGGSLLYNWNIGMGVDYVGLIAYYLGSPLNLLSVLVPEKLLLPFFSLLMPVKLGLAGLFFSIFLKRLFDRDDFAITVFGSFYALCAWALGFQWNIMWLDTFALTPLVILGEIALLRDRKFLLYTGMLFLAVLINYYIGLFVCYFVALVFLCYEICRFDGWKKFFADLALMAVFSALALGMTAVLELPAAAALQNTQSSVNAFPTGFRLNIATKHNWIGLLDAMRQVAGNMGGGIEPNFKEGLPNLYCGVITVILGFLFLMVGQIRLRDKLCAVGLLLFFNVSFIIRQLDYIWHGFHFPNMIPYRFSFLYSFVLLYMAYRVWLLRQEIKPYKIVAAGLFTAAVLCCCKDLTAKQDIEILKLKWKAPVYLIFNGSFLLAYLGALLYGAWEKALPEGATPTERRNYKKMQCRKRILSRCMVLGICCVELIATLSCFGLYFTGTDVRNYPRGGEEAASMIRYMHEREKYSLCYRAEMTHSQSLNDGALNGYSGISAFTSSANVRITEFMRALGYGAKNTYNRYCFEESSPVANLFLNLKYMIERDGKDRTSSVFDEVHHYGNVHLLKNSAYLPLGFLAERPLGMVEFKEASSEFALQNTLFSAAIDEDVNVWSWLRTSRFEVTGDGTTVSNVKNGSCSYGDTGPNAAVEYSWEMEEDGFLCIQLDFPKRNSFTVRVNGIDLYREDISLPQMLAVGDVEQGDEITLRINCPSGETGKLYVTGAVMDEEIFRHGYEKLAASTLELTEFKDTYVEGTIDCNRDGLLYTSIPQNGNWSAKVDGEDAEIKLVGDCMIALELTQGRHRVSFTYRNEAFSLGWKISAVCALVFAGIAWVVYRPERKKK